MSTLQDPETVARTLGISKQQLAALRLRAAAGPRFLRVGRLIRYDVEDVRAFVESQKRLSTSDAAASA